MIKSDNFIHEETNRTSFQYTASFYYDFGWSFSF